MKRRNADIVKMRRPIKRTKIPEAIYGSSFTYAKFISFWLIVIVADYLLEFRFEFIYPFWILFQAAHETFKFQGLAFTIVFLCMAVTSDIIFFMVIPLQYIYFLAGTYVWVHYTWSTFCDKPGMFAQTVILCCMMVYAECTVIRSPPPEIWRPLAAHCIGYPAMTIGFGIKSYVSQIMRERRQRLIRAENEFYFQLLRESLPESALEQSQNGIKESSNMSEAVQSGPEVRHMNDTLKKRFVKENGLCPTEHAQLRFKLEKLEKHLAQRERDKANQTLERNPFASSQSVKTQTSQSADNAPAARTHNSQGTQTHSHVNGNGCAKGAGAANEDDTPESKAKEPIAKDLEINTKECSKGNRDSSSNKEREKEKEREAKEKEKREKEERIARECIEELRRVKTELAAARNGEADARRELAAAVATERTRRAEHAHLKHAHTALQHKMNTWRNERMAMERRQNEERRQPNSTAPTPKQATGECSSTRCRSKLNSQEAEASSLRRELQRARERAERLQRDLVQASEQVRTLEARQEEAKVKQPCTRTWQALQERAAHLELSLSSETRVKLELLSALGDAKRHMTQQEGLITRQEKEIEELKAQMVAVMPSEPVRPMSGAVSKLRLLEQSDQYEYFEQFEHRESVDYRDPFESHELYDRSPLDPAAPHYTPKRLCSDA
ncbi:macoilin isoform X2 [Leptidea sinapis]|uniref:macoilin isoform X2 n=1 Tax=Leptidea sinapis TaxID=189913 RepID=UPI0021301E8B|nr:macoilin isoform X2 [Leptidea sinapis]